MKTNYLIIVLIVALSLLMLSGCGKDGDGQLDVKEPMRELSEMPKGKDWFNTPISQQPTDGSQN